MTPDRRISKTAAQLRAAAALPEAAEPRAIARLLRDLAVLLILATNAAAES